MTAAFWGCLGITLILTAVLVDEVRIGRKKKQPTYADEQLRQWDDELLNCQCDLAMARFQMIANDPDFDEEVIDALFLVETGIQPIREEV